MGRSMLGRQRAGVAAGLLAVAFTASLAGAGAASGAPAHAPGAVHPASLTSSFSQPVGEAAVGSDLYVANWQGNSVTEVDTVHRTVIQVISGAAFRFDRPAAIVADGPDLFVASRGGRVTAFAAGTGRITKPLWAVYGPPYMLMTPSAIVADGPDVFVVDAGGMLTEISTAKGTLVKVISGKVCGFDDPTAAVLAGGDLWVTNEKGNSVTAVQVNVPSPVCVVNLGGPTYGLSAPAGIAFDKAHVWLADSGSNSVTEIMVSTHKVVQQLTSSQYGLTSPAPILFGGKYVYVASPPGGSPMVTAILPSGGVFEWMMCNTNYHFQFDNPQALIVVGPNIWVANEGGNSLTELNALSGILVGSGPIA